jgi:hypothetical protein
MNNTLQDAAVDIARSFLDDNRNLTPDELASLSQTAGIKQKDPEILAHQVLRDFAQKKGSFTDGKGKSYAA